MRVLILGGYGFIGLEITRRLVAAGHSALGLGRSADTGKRLFPAANWVEADIAQLDTPESWKPYLSGVDIVVNAAGVLQDGYVDDVVAVHHSAIRALVSACEGDSPTKLVQISAVGASPESEIPFLRSKGQGDVAVKSSKLAWNILRPGLVIGANAYGGTAFLRMAASVPLIQPITFGDSRIQSVAISDLCDAVLDCVERRIEDGHEFDLVEPNAHTLRDVTGEIRRWLGWKPAKVINFPGWMSAAVARMADGFGYLGWRPPVRTTAMQVLAGNVLGDPSSFTAATGRELKSLNQTLAEIPATIQDRWYARLYLLFPFVLGVLSFFWLVSGGVALWDVEAASAETGLPAAYAKLAAVTGALVDIVLGLALLFRPLSVFACWGMLCVSSVYLVAGAILKPELWMDPLGPLVKVFPAMMLTVVALAMLGARR